MSVPAANLNLRTARKAAIKRASARARISLRRIDRGALERLTDLYGQTRDDLQDLIRNAGDNTGIIRLERLQDLLGQTTARLRQLEVARNDLFGAELLEAAAAGIDPFRATAIASTAFNNIPEQTVRVVQSFIDSDGLQLSDRLWRIDRGAREAVGNAIERSVILGHSASAAARDFLSRGEVVPADIQAKLGDAAAEGISKAAGKALMQGEGNAYDKALRVFRTEINRAHNSAYEAAAFEDPEVAGTRFLLSPNHPRPDICDMHANVNLYGLGKGVYTEGKNPYPAHPNTLSFIVAVFADEVTDADRQGKETRTGWLKRQSPGVQQSVLGSIKKRAALERGLLKENQIATPWKVLKTRYIRQGIDIESLIPVVTEAVTTTSLRTPSRLIPVGSPISGAFEARRYARQAEHVLQVIDSVHGDGRLPVISITSAPSSASFLGRYSGSAASGRIQVTAGSTNKEFTLTHEIGHFLDHHGIQGEGFASLSDSKFAGWRSAIDNTPEVQHLRNLIDGPEVMALPSGMRIRKPEKLLQYLTLPYELWARSYTQYIATKSGDKLLQAQLAAGRSIGGSGELLLPAHWQDDHFVAVAREMDKLFEGLGWLKK